MTPEEARERGSMRSERKTQAARSNGRLGGGVLKPLDEPCECPMTDGKHERTCRMWWRVYRSKKSGQSQHADE